MAMTDCRRDVASGVREEVVLVLVKIMVVETQW